MLEAGFDLNMMGMHAALERSKIQWSELLGRAGLMVRSFMGPPGGVGEGVIEAFLGE